MTTKNSADDLPTDPVEAVVAEALTLASIPYERTAGGLDFHLPGFGISIECKRFYSDRAIRQMATAGEAILVQGIEAAYLLRSLAAENARLRHASLADENAQLRRETERITAILGDRFLLDPPDGGDVKLHEGVQRMADALAKAETTTAGDRS
jgi:hypothetical protein